MRSLLISTIEALEGFEIVEAANGFEALRLLPREQVDLVITDINMPDINGLELIRYIRGSGNYSTIPLFIISTESSDKDLCKGLALGANEYLVKPFEPAQLQRLLLKYLG
jgi:two-component system chemotaxis response regulator CheY